MITVFDIRTSLEFWRRAYPGKHAPRNPVALPEEELAETKQDVWGQAPPWLTREFLDSYQGVLHVYTREDHGSHSSKTHCTHKLPTGIPGDSFFRLNSGAYVASPELVFLEAARFLNMAQLIALGDELCGLYGFDSADPRKLRKRPAPLTSKAALAAYLAQCEGCRGVKRAAAALPYVVERSASPMETLCVMLICLPCRLGGYGLAQPDMNRRIDLTPGAARIAGKGHCYGDLCWLGIHLILEYLGDYDHSQPKRSLSDRARTNALKTDGYDVIELTLAQVKDLVAFEKIVLYVAGKLGREIRAAKRGPAKARLALREALFSWNAGSGRLPS